MKVFKDNQVIACFSDAGDGDLSFYNFDDKRTEQVWNALPVVREYGFALPTYAHQVHQDRVLPISAGTRTFLAGDADGLITSLVERPIGVFSADCLPLIIYSGSVTAAVHAGWRSTCLNIAQKAVAAFSAEHGIAAGSLRALIGPCIGRCCLEMGDEVFEQFTSADPQWEQFFERRAKWHLNLRALNRWQLQQAGIPEAAIIDHDECTFCRQREYFSYRRQRQRNGSMFSFVVRCG